MTALAKVPNAPTAPKIAPNLDPMALAKELSGVHFIGGKKVPAAGGKNFDIISPATREKVAQAAFGTAEDVDRAVKNAAEVQKEWAKKTPRERGRLVMECGRLLAEHAEELA